jgi:hypothetical protein
VFEVVSDREIRRAGTFWIVSGGGGLRHLLFRGRPFAVFVSPVLGEFAVFARSLASRGRSSLALFWRMGETCILAIQRPASLWTINVTVRTPALTHPNSPTCPRLH